MMRWYFTVIAALLLSAVVIAHARAHDVTEIESDLIWKYVAIPIEPENRCSEYDSDDYSYTSSIEHHIVEQQGGVWSPYTLERFDSIKETDIEHIVPRSEGHDSGLCARSKDARRGFARDLLNLTLADPTLNRYEKADHDPAEWLPVENLCWYIARWIGIKYKWQLTADQKEIDAIDNALQFECGGFALVRP